MYSDFIPVYVNFAYRLFTHWYAPATQVQSRVWSCLNMNFMQTHYNRLRLYAANIVLPCICMHTVRNFSTKIKLSIVLYLKRERSGSVVECLTLDWRAAGSSLTGVTALCPWARHIKPCLVLVQLRKTHPDITERLLTGTYWIKSNRKKYKQALKLWADWIGNCLRSFKQQWLWRAA